MEIGYSEWERNKGRCNRCVERFKPSEKIILGDESAVEQRRRDAEESHKRDSDKWLKRVLKNKNLV